ATRRARTVVVAALGVGRARAALHRAQCTGRAMAGRIAVERAAVARRVAGRADGAAATRGRTNVRAGRIGRAIARAALRRRDAGVIGRLAEIAADVATQLAQRVRLAHARAALAVRRARLAERLEVRVDHAVAIVVLAVADFGRAGMYGRIGVVAVAV